MKKRVKLRKKRRPGLGKGPAFERKCCKQLSLWISWGERDDVFWRSAMSGGRATIGLQKGKKRGSQAGDMSAISVEGDLFLKVFVAEFKHRKDLQLHNFLAKHSGNTIRFWEKHLEECKAFGRCPFMVAKQNVIPALLLTSEEGLMNLQRMCWNIDHVPGLILAKVKNIWVLEFETFLTTKIQNIKGKRKERTRLNA